MSIVHGSINFTGVHEQLREPSFDVSIQIDKFCGVRGEKHLIDEQGGRELTCRVWIDGYNTEADLVAALNTNFYQQVGQITGTLTVSGRSYVKCTFIGYEEEQRFQDGSGVNGYTSIGILRWRQRSRA